MKNFIITNKNSIFIGALLVLAVFITVGVIQMYSAVQTSGQAVTKLSATMDSNYQTVLAALQNHAQNINGIESCLNHTQECLGVTSTKP